MIRRVGNVSLFVSDQDRAKDFYTRILGFELRQDAPLYPGMRVADVGSGTGLFLAPLAEGVGAEGRVLALDISPRFVEHLEGRARQEGLANVEVRLCAEDSIGLEKYSIDLAFVCDTYHHIDARVAYFEKLRAELRPGGRLVIVDFAKGDFPVGPPDAHKLAPETVIDELARAGWRLVRREALRYQYALVFEPEEP